MKITEPPQEDGDGWISVVPKHHRKSFNPDDASHHRKKFSDLQKQGKGSSSTPKKEPGAKERKKSFAKERPKKARAQSEAVTKDKDAFRALSKRNPEWANESAIADSESETPFSTETANHATEQFEAWKSKMKGTSHEETDLVSSLPVPNTHLVGIPIAPRFRRRSNHEDLIWGTSSSPQESLFQRRPSEAGLHASKFRDIFNPSSPKAPTSPLANSPVVPGSAPLNVPTATASVPIASVPIAQYSNSANTYLGTLSSSPNLNNGQLYYSSPLGSMANLPVGSPNLRGELPYGSAPKFQSEYLRQITTFNSPQ